MYPRMARLYSDAVLHARGWGYERSLHRLERTQWEDPEAVRADTFRRLHELLTYCREQVPFYRQQFSTLGLDPRDIQSQHELSALPVIDKKMLHADYSQFFACDVANGWDVWPSSGSTGEPFPFRIDKSSIATNTFAALARGRRWWDLDYGVREAMIWSGVRDVSNTRAGRVAAFRRRVSWALKNQRLVDVYHLDLAGVRRAYERLSRFKPPLVRAIASGLFRFCAGLEELGLDGRALGVRAAIYTGEGLTGTQRLLIERVLGCRTVCEYGCTELGVIAFECPNGGIHVNHDNLLVEYVKDGRMAGPGEEAEIVVTNLSDRVAPLVRYAVGDIVVPDDSRCSCGRTLPLLQRIGGRSHDTILTPDGTAVHALYFTHVFDRIPEVHQFRVVQDSLERLRVELCGTSTIPASAVDKVRVAVERAMGAGVDVRVEQVEELPVAASGKTQWIVSHVSSR